MIDSTPWIGWIALIKTVYRRQEGTASLEEIAGVQVVQEYRCYMWTELGKRLQEYRVQVLQVVTCGES